MFSLFIFRLIHFGQFLNGLAGPIAMGAPPTISAEWFPPEQRTTATAIATVTNTLGLAVSFLLGISNFNISPCSCHCYVYNIIISLP